MPCYLFTYHAYGSWLPDHPRGYVQRGKGILPPDAEMAARYRGNLLQDAVRFDAQIQKLLIEGTLEACRHQELTCHFIATEVTHAHVLVSWKTERSWMLVRRQIRGNITRSLNKEFCRQEWFSKSPSRKRVKDQEHFDHLISSYLPKHSGLKWSQKEGIHS
jgi:hypothetical protein